MQIQIPRIKFPDSISQIQIPRFKFLLDKVNVAHNKTITFMTFEKCNRPIWPLYCQLNVLPLSLLIQIEYAKTMYKFENKLLPQAFENYFRKPSHDHFTRFAQHNFEKIRITSMKEKSLLKYIGPNIWTNIPQSIKNSLSLKVFIKSYKIHLIGNYTDS